MNLQTGAFGDPSQTETLVLFWAKMEELHYPGAGTTKAFLEEKLERERQQAVMAQAQQQAMAQAQTAQQQAVPPDVMEAVEQRAQQDVLAAAGQGQTGFSM